MPQNLKGIGAYSSLGLEFAGCVLFGLLGGQWLDQKFGTGSILTITGLLFGVAAAFRSVWRALQRANREAERFEAAEQKARKQFHDSPTSTKNHDSKPDQN